MGDDRLATLSCHKVRVCPEAVSRDAAPVYNPEPVEAQTTKSTQDLLSESKGGHARRGVGGGIRKLKGDETAYPSYPSLLAHRLKNNSLSFH